MSLHEDCSANMFVLPLKLKFDCWTSTYNGVFIYFYFVFLFKLKQKYINTSSTIVHQLWCEEN